VALAWIPSLDPEGDLVRYTVYLGADPSELSPVCQGSLFATCTVGLEPRRVYYWKVVAVDEQGAESEGGPWSFTTGPALGIVEGRVLLEGRADWSGARVSLGELQVETDPEGRFSLQVEEGEYPGQLVVTRPGYLPAVRGELGVLRNTVTVLPRVRLLAGDGDGDGVVGPSDLRLTSAAMGGQEPGGVVDFNGDGVVDIYDLAMVGKNFGRRGSPWD
jgi:hypothetical protein